MSRTLRILLQLRKSPSQPPLTVCCLQSLDPGARAGHLPAPSLRAPSVSDMSDSGMSHHMFHAFSLGELPASRFRWTAVGHEDGAHELWALVVCQLPCVVLPSYVQSCMFHFKAAA